MKTAYYFLMIVLLSTTVNSHAEEFSTMIAEFSKQPAFADAMKSQSPAPIIAIIQFRDQDQNLCQPMSRNFADDIAQEIQELRAYWPAAVTIVPRKDFDKIENELNLSGDSSSSKTVIEKIKANVLISGNWQLIPPDEIKIVLEAYQLKGAVLDTLATKNKIFKRGIFPDASDYCIKKPDSYATTTKCHSTDDDPIECLFFQ